MILPFSWLKDYVEVNVSAEELKDKLFSCGFEVEELTYLGKDVTGVVVGKILEVKKHPDADRLRVCRVDCGAHGEKTICTAATNVFEGALVPCALDGATVRGEGGVRKIRTGKLRGIVSEGMMCSGAELGITDDFYDGAETDGILLLGEDAPVGGDIRPVVGLDDYLFDIAVTANRPDCQSVFGMAREVAAILKLPLKSPACDHRAAHTEKKMTVAVREPALCPRYAGRYVDGVKIGRSPQWMRRRLALCGIRSISNIVDITNFVLLEMGQPMHAFDCRYLKDNICVRLAREGERITTLDGKTFTLRGGDLLVCDGDRPVALAGIMGGKESEISPETREVFFEAAKFARGAVRRTSRALGQRSDSSARFEKGVSAYTAPIAMDRAMHLVEELGCGVVTDCCADEKAEELSAKTIHASFKRIDDLLGIEVPRGEARDILTRLGFTVAAHGEDLAVTVPLWRDDVDDYPDLAEEIIRSYGYEHIEPAFLRCASVTRGALAEGARQEMKFKEALTGEGFFEALNYAFCSPSDCDLLRLPADAPERGALKILNPIGEELSVMRTQLVSGLLAAVVRNVRRGNESGRLFELANVYFAKNLPLAELPEERRRAALAVWGDGDFFDLKGAIEAVAQAFGLSFTYARTQKPFLHSGVSAAVFLGEREVGWLGELHPAVAEELALEKKTYLAELDYAALAAAFAGGANYRGVPKFPNVLRDVAFVVEEGVTCAEAENCILFASRAAKRAELFDVYRDARLGGGKKSMAFRIAFAGGANAEKPLSPEAVEREFEKVVSALEEKLGAKLRK